MRACSSSSHAGDGRDHLARQVVLRRAEPAGAMTRSARWQAVAKHGDVVGQVVGDGGVEADRDADLGEPAAEPLAVGVEVLAAGQFAADRDDFGFHDEKSLTGMGRSVWPPEL